jgi:hypothetical protein
MCVEGSSPRFLSNFGMSEGSLSGIVDHEGLWEIRSFLNYDRSGKYNFARKGKIYKIGHQNGWDGNRNVGYTNGWKIRHDRCPHIEGPIVKGMDGVFPMVLREGNVDIIGMPLVPLEDGIDGSCTLEQKLGPDMV